MYDKAIHINGLSRGNISPLPLGNTHSPKILVYGLKIMLSYQKQPSKALSVAALRQVIVRALEKGWVRETPHSEHERAYRNISDEDVMHGLERSDWVIDAPPDYDGKHKSWEYLIKTCDLEGVELHLKLTASSTDGTVRVITKY